MTLAMRLAGFGLLLWSSASSAAPIARYAETALVSDADICYIPSEKIWQHAGKCPAYTQSLAEVGMLHVHTDYAQFGLVDNIDPSRVILKIAAADLQDRWRALAPPTLLAWSWVDDHYFVSWGKQAIEPGHFLRISVEVDGRLREDRIVYLLP